MTRTCLSCCPGTLSGQGMLEVQGLASEIMHKTLTLALNDQPKAESLRYCCKVAIIVARLSAVWMSANSCTDSRAMTSYICSKETFFLWCCCERRSPMHLISHYWNFISNRQINTDFFPGDLQKWLQQAEGTETTTAVPTTKICSLSDWESQFHFLQLDSAWLQHCVPSQSKHGLQKNTVFVLQTSCVCNSLFRNCKEVREGWAFGSHNNSFT